MLIIDQLDQSRKPVRGDLIAFVKDGYWVRAKIISRAASYQHYYNVELENGSKDGVYLKPPVEEYKESWTLLTDPDLWNPRPPEQLRDTPPARNSRQVTPVTTPTQERIHEDQLHEGHLRQDRQLLLDPNHQLQAGRVHRIPQLLHVPRPNRVNLHWPPGTDPEYARRVEEIANSNYLPPSQEHLRIQLAVNQATTEAKSKEKSISVKVKKAFKWVKK